MSRSLPRLLVFLQTIWLWHLIRGKHVYLFGVTPYKDLMAVSIDSSLNGKSHAIEFPLRLPLLREVTKISYDGTSKNILVESNHGGVQQSALCHTRLAYHKPLLNTSELVYLEEDGGSTCWNCKVTSYALYKSNIYFILYGQFEDKAGVKATKVQLRVMQSCNTCNLTQSINDYATFELFRAPFLFNCSKRVAEIYNSRISGDTDVRLKTGHALKIVNENGELSFFFQIFYGKSYSPQGSHFVDLDLYHVTEQGTVELLHTESVHRRFAQWKINGVAGVDYNAGVLCWTAGDRIYCGDFVDQQLSNAKMVLYPGDSVTEGVCKGNRRNLLPIVTGISIINVTASERSLVFGCYTQWPSLGGAGLLRTNTKMTGRHVFPIYLGRQPLMLGSLFTTPEVIKECRPNEDVAMCENPNDYPKDASRSSTDGMHPVKEKTKDKNRTLKISKIQSTPYMNSVSYRIHSKPNDTDISPIEYDLDQESIVLSNQDREFLNTKGIGNGCEHLTASRVHLIFVALHSVLSLAAWFPHPNFKYIYL